MAKFHKLPCLWVETQVFLCNASLHQVGLHLAVSLECAHSTMQSTLHSPLVPSLLPFIPPFMHSLPISSLRTFGHVLCTYCSVSQLWQGKAEQVGQDKSRCCCKRAMPPFWPVSGRLAKPGLGGNTPHFSHPSPAQGLFWAPCSTSCSPALPHASLSSHPLPSASTWHHFLLLSQPSSGASGLSSPW